MKKTLLVIDDDRVFAEAVRDYLTSNTVEVLLAHKAMDGLTLCSLQRIDVVLLDQQLPDGEGHTLCPAILKYNDQTKIIFDTAYPSFDNAVKAIRSGAYDYLSKPFDLEELALAVKQAFRTLELEQVEQVQDYQREKEREDAVVVPGVGLADSMQLAEIAASTNAPVLITGETGTGKTLLAKAIHYKGPASKAPFISINCASLPENLMEAELFGYEKGAFTGAVIAKRGIFEMAEGGTLFLDEIGEIPLHLQAKLLSVIEDRHLRRIGSESLRPVNARVIAATSVKLEDTLGAAFRKDLYYRLSVVRIHMPPLRERRQDIPALCMHLLGQLSGGRQVKLEDGELRRLSAYNWPGNVRELKNILERSVLLQQGPRYRPSELLGDRVSERAEPPLPYPDAGTGEILSLVEVELRHLRHVFHTLEGNYTRTAKALGISVSTLKRKMKEQNEATTENSGW
jgi:DNA-binding NtrC family response regulator